MAAYTLGACLNLRATPKFSLAGNCGAPERLNTNLTDKNTQRGGADHDPNAPAGVYMRHFRSLP